MHISWVETTSEKYWQKREAGARQGALPTLEITDAYDQELDGFGGCFNELGWIALGKLSAEEKAKVLDLLFSPTEDGLRLNFCRTPVGASDYAARWYSYNETPLDFEMTHFSIEADRENLLPYIKEALSRKPDMKLFASPWSPPAWMKTPPVYNHGLLNRTPENLRAYAAYFVKYIKAYEKEGVHICQLHPQNEPAADQKFPSCLWTGEECAEFIGEYLGPAFEEADLDTEIWLGTLNVPSFMAPGQKPFAEVEDGFNRYAYRALTDPKAAKYIKGVGYQWEGKDAVRRTHECFPHLRLANTENECGDGQNTWGYAKYVFDLFRHYLTSGANLYCYWNMVLEGEGKSTWGWKQNALVGVEDGRAVLRPEYYVMKHFSRFLLPGARRVILKGCDAGNSVAFLNPDGQLVLITRNPLGKEKSLTVSIKGAKHSFTLAPDSIHSMVFDMA